MDCGKEAVEYIFKVVEADTELMIQHLDLIFKWFTLRICERENTPTLIRLLEMMALCLEKLTGESGVRVHEAEPHQLRLPPYSLSTQFPTIDLNHYSHLYHCHRVRDMPPSLPCRQRATTFCLTSKQPS